MVMPSLLRDAMKGILCDEVRLDRKKVGFNSSMTTVKLKSKETINFIHNHKEGLVITLIVIISLSF